MITIAKAVAAAAAKAVVTEQGKTAFEIVGQLGVCWVCLLCVFIGSSLKKLSKMKQSKSVLISTKVTTNRHSKLNTAQYRDVCIKGGEGVC